MRPPPFVLALALALPATAAAESHQWSKDGRLLLAERSSAGVFGDVQIARRIDLWTGEIEVSQWEGKNCAFIAAHGVGEIQGGRGDVAAARKRCETALQKERDAHEAFVAAFPRGSEAKPSRRSSDGAGDVEILVGDVPVEVAEGGEMAQRSDAQRARVRVRGPEGRPVHERTVDGRDGLSCWWSPDGQWLVVEGRYGNEHTVVPGVARVDVLDAGAGSRLAAVTDALGRAGYPPAHQGTAKTARTASEVFVAPGFEEDGVRIAKALGLPESAVKPLSWKTPYAVTVAAGEK